MDFVTSIVTVFLTSVCHIHVLSLELQFPYCFDGCKQDNGVMSELF